MNGRPTWATPAGASVPSARPRPPATLVAAAAGVVVLAAVEAAYVAGRDDLQPALRAALTLGIALQLPCAWLALRRSSTAAMALLLCSFTALVACITTGRIVAALAAGGVLALLGSSLRWFPTAEPWRSER
jgi:hypothetical protein